MTELHVNLTAYEGVEDLSRFTDHTFKKYCDDKMAACDKHISFIRKHLPDRKIKVLEIGSGSGKLLFRLEKEGMLEKGIGFEISSSRKAFSDKFGQYVNSTVVENLNQDFLTADLNDEKFDLLIGIDVVINLIGAISPDHIDIFIKKVLSCLAPDGIIIMESMTLSREIEAIKKSESGQFRTWKKFLDSDPFKYGLDQMSLDDAGNVVWDKFFISRDSLKEERFTNILKPLDKSEFENYIQRYGLTGLFFDKWDDNDDTLDDEYIALIK